MNIINSSIFFAEWWRTKDDKPVDCFTTITIEDLESGTYKPANPEHFEQARNYLKQIKEKHRGLSQLIKILRINYVSLH